MKKSSRHFNSIYPDLKLYALPKHWVKKEGKWRKQWDERQALCEMLDVPASQVMTRPPKLNINHMKASRCVKRLGTKLMTRHQYSPSPITVTSTLCAADDPIQRAETDLENTGWALNPTEKRWKWTLTKVCWSANLRKSMNRQTAFVSLWVINP